jgi:hypothetical protein
MTSASLGQNRRGYEYKEMKMMTAEKRGGSGGGLHQAVDGKTAAAICGMRRASARFLVWKEGKRCRVSSLPFQRGRGEVWSAVE